MLIIARDSGSHLRTGASCRGVFAPANSGIIKQGHAMSLEEAILDKVRRLPRAKQEEVLRFADGLERNAAARRVPSRDRSSEMKWIDENRTAYADQWVAVEGDRLIAASMDPLRVFAAAKAAGIQTPFVVHVLPEDPLPFIPGW